MMKTKKSRNFEHQLSNDQVACTAKALKFQKFDFEMKVKNIDDLAEICWHKFLCQCTNVV